MAYDASLLHVPVDAVLRVHTRESLYSSVVHASHCSHFIAAIPGIRPILEDGTPLQTEMWHPIAKPHYRLPAELPPLIAVLRQIEENDPVKNDAWTLAEVRRLREACDYAIQHRLALVVFLSSTLSKPPLRKQ